MFFDSAHPHSSGPDAHESRHRFGMTLAEIWHEWFDAMSLVAYQTHRACEFLAENGGPSNGQYGPFDFRSPRNSSEAWDGSIDMDKLRQCLHEMDPAQAARVIHAVQTMQAMEAMLKRRRSRTGEAEEPAW
jgi:hypothetical protein